MLKKYSILENIIVPYKLGTVRNCESDLEEKAVIVATYDEQAFGYGNKLLEV